MPLSRKESHGPGLSAHAIPHGGADTERRHEEIARSARPDFKRDRDRLFHSKAFLQLDQKSELFTEPTGEQPPSRLLYALRTASTARALAELLHLNEEVAEAAVLARSLGLPPFGRAGIEALAARMAGHGGFDPVAQSLRIVDELEARYPEFNGLNLSAAVRDALQPESPSLSLEARAAMWATRITTACLDLEWGIDAGLLDEGRLPGFALWCDVAGPTERHYPRLEAVRRRHYHFRNLLTLLVDGVVAHSTREGAAPEIGLSPGMEDAFAALERWIGGEVRHAPRHEALYRDRAACVDELFAIYVHRPHLMGEAALLRIKKEGVHRAAADFLSHRGDRELLRLRREIVGEREPAQRATEQSLLL